MKHFKQITKTIAFSMSILGTTIGAGFVSGKEIANFLGVYGNFAYLIAFLFGIIYYFTIMLFYKCADSKIITNDKWFDYIILFTQFISLSAMIAGLNSLLTDYFGTQTLFYILCVICFIIILCGLKGLTNSNLLLMPIVLVFILYLGYIALSSNTQFNIETTNSTPTKIFSYFFIYLGLDLLSCYPICAVLSDKQSKKQKVLSAIIVATSIFSLITCYLFSVLNRGSNYAYFDLPVLHFIIDHNDKLFLFTCFIVGIGIVTTLLSNGFVIYDTSKKLWDKNGFIIFLSLFCGAYIISFFGFSNIVEFLYPLIGVTGLFLISILIYRLRQKNKSRKNP